MPERETPVKRGAPEKPERPLSGAAAHNFPGEAAGASSCAARCVLGYSDKGPRLNRDFYKDNITGRCKPRAVSLSIHKLSIEKQDRDPKIVALIGSPCSFSALSDNGTSHCP